MQGPESCNAARSFLLQVVLADPDDILLNRETMIEAHGSTGGTVFFYFKANAISDKTATLTLNNTNGDNPPMTVTLTVP